MPLSGHLFFEDQDTFEKFEGFVTELLNKGVGLEGLPEKRRSLRGLTSTANYGSRGDNQRGVDLVGLLQNGEQIVFQCKYRTAKAKRRYSKTEATAAVKLAEAKYPEAAQYVLVTNYEFTPSSSDVLNGAAWWSWDGSRLLSLVQTLPREEGYHLIAKHFDSNLALKLYPDGPNLLIEPSTYRASFAQSQLSHEQACVGREKEIEEVIGRLTTTKPRAVLMLGKGGIGKSRVFCEVMERLDKEHDPNVLARIVQAKTDSALTAQLFRKDIARIIIAMDECHLSGYFREDVAKALKDAGPDHRLFISARPEAASDLREKLRRMGWDVDEKEIHLGPLGKQAMQELATNVAGKNDREIRQLANLSDGNALVTVVGCRLIKKKKLKLGEAIHSDEFKKQVYQALEDSFISQMSSNLRSSARNALSVLSALSPWKKDDDETILGLLQLPSESFSFIDERLLDTGLLRSQGDERRIIPDLFSENLANKFLGNSTSNGSFLRRLKSSEYLYRHAVVIIRNLSLCRWKEGNAARHLDEILEDLHDHFSRRFKESSNKERSKILSLWKGRAITAPEKVLALCQLGFDLPSKPEHQIHGFHEQSQDVERMYLKGVYKDLFTLISDLVIALPEEKRKLRHEALELLWSNRDKLQPQGNSVREDPPFSVFAISERRTPESWQDSLAWLEERIASSPEDLWLTTRTSQVRDFLAPTFSAYLDKIEYSNRTMMLSATLTPLDFAPSARTTALKIIDHLGSKSEMGALNCLGLLQEIAWPPRSRYGGEIPAQWSEKWMTHRVQALEIIGRIQEARPEVMVQVKARQVLQTLSRLNKQPKEFLADCKKRYSKIVETDELSLYVSLVSNDWREYPSRSREERSWVAWEKLCHRGADYLLREHSVDLPEQCDLIGKELSIGKWKVYWGSLFEVISESPAQIIALLEYLLANPEASYSGSMEYLCQLSGEKDQWLSRFVKPKNGQFISQASFALMRSHESENYPKTEAALISLGQNADESTISILLEHALHSLFEESKINDLILSSIPWRLVTVDHLRYLDGQVSDYNSPFSFPVTAFPKFYDRLLSLPKETVHLVGSIIAQSLHRDPDSAFSFFHERVINSRPDEEDVLPYDLPSFSDSGTFANDRTKALETLELVLKYPENRLFNKWYRVAFLDLHPELLIEKIESASFAEFISILKILKKSGKTTCLNEPEIVEALFTRCLTDFPNKKVDVEEALMRSTCMQGRSSINGVPDNDAVLKKSRELTSRFAADDSLRNFYQGIVDYEEEHRSKSIQEHEAGVAQDNKF